MGIIRIHRAKSHRIGVIKSTSSTIKSFGYVGCCRTRVLARHKENEDERNCYTTQKGFTLIELLVVIAIIVILAAILFPVFARARENARRARCQSNVKQIMLGVLQYTQDFDEMYPLALADNQVTQGRSWYTAIFPYVKSAQIFKCPSDSDNTAAPESNLAGVPAFPVSYIVNTQFGMFSPDSTQPASNGKVAPVSLAAVQSTATTIYMADGLKQTDGITTTPTSADKLGGYRLMPYANFASAKGTDANWGGPSPRYVETAIFGFTDGHVKSGRSSAYYGPSDGTDGVTPATTGKGTCLNPALGCQ